jgi:5-methylthioribose kinase
MASNFYQLPEGFQLDPADPASAERHLRRLGWIAPDDTVRALRKAGEGNMNLVLRVDLGWRSLIVKQARPWVEKYPDIPAPADRVLVEAAFYGAVADHPRVADLMPRLLGLDAPSRMLAVEDLGEANDLLDAYAGRPITPAEQATLAGWLAALHAVPVPDEPLLHNRAMRALNHAHIFELPLTSDHPAAAALRADATFADTLTALGQRYLADGPALVHGDYYPGSWMRTPAGLRVLDPEFAHTGEPAFDLGVMVAHLTFAGADGEAALAAVTAAYHRPFDVALTRGFAGAELTRRLLGVARLPVDPAKTAYWLELARAWVASC